MYAIGAAANADSMVAFIKKNVFAINIILMKKEKLHRILFSFEKYFAYFLFWVVDIFPHIVWNSNKIAESYFIVAEFIQRVATRMRCPHNTLPQKFFASQESAHLSNAIWINRETDKKWPHEKKIVDI